MTSRINGDNDRELRALFSGLTPPVPDDGFTRLVVKRVHSAVWLRRSVLSVAAFGGLVLATPAVTKLLVFAGAGLQQLTMQILAVVNI